MPNAKFGLSVAERLFEQQLLDAGLGGFEREYQFHPERKWRFDFAWPEQRLALEVEGGVWGRGRHLRPQGFIDDCEKYNEAALLGWRVLRVPSEWVTYSMQAVELVRRALC